MLIRGNLVLNIFSVLTHRNLVGNALSMLIHENLMVNTFSTLTRGDLTTYENLVRRTTSPGDRIFGWVTVTVKTLHT